MVCADLADGSLSHPASVSAARVEQPGTGGVAMKNAAKTQPHCRSCGGTDIDYIYAVDTEFTQGGGYRISESGVLSMACLFLAEEIDQLTDDPARRAEMSYTLFELSIMEHVRREAKEESEPKGDKE
jgi:hypothetical protein